jgi:hypothetical protein
MADTEAKKAEDRPQGQRLDDAIDATRGKISQVAGAVREKFEHGREPLVNSRKRASKTSLRPRRISPRNILARRSSAESPSDS